MPRFNVFLIGALVVFVTLVSATMVSPDPALAAPGILQFDASLQSGPQDDAASVSWLPAGTEVYVTGDQAGGYYPVTVGVLTGWIRADALVFEAQTPVAPVSPGAATPVSSDVVPGALPVEASVAEPPLDPNAPSVTVPDPGPIGPAAVLAEVPIYAGPGTDFGVLGMAATGQMVEQTGHAIGGYVTVRYVGITGWVPLDHLGPAPTTASS